MSLFILDDMIVDESESHENKRVKITTACDTCRRRKVKCDGASPCANCTRGGLKSLIIIYLSYICLNSYCLFFVPCYSFFFVPIISTSRDKTFTCFNRATFPNSHANNYLINF